MNRRSFLGSAAAVVALPALGVAASPQRAERIRISGFDDRTVFLAFPSERARHAFWVAFTDAAWPNREGEHNRRLFEKFYGAILRGEGPHGGFTCLLARRSFFDDYALKAAATLKEQNILLEVIKSEKTDRSKRETIVLPKFSTVTKASV